MSDLKTKDATVNIHLNADSGYVSHDAARISADQWGRIINIVHENEDVTPQGDSNGGAAHG